MPAYRHPVQPHLGQIGGRGEAQQPTVITGADRNRQRPDIPGHSVVPGTGRLNDARHHRFHGICEGRPGKPLPVTPDILRIRQQLPGAVKGKTKTFRRG